MHKKLIFSILDSPAMGGAERYLLDNLVALEPTRVKVILATNNSQVKKTAKNFRNFQIINFPLIIDFIGDWKGLTKTFFNLPAALTWFIHQAKKLCRQTTYPLVLLPGFSDRLVATPIFKLLGCQVIWIEYGPLKPSFEKNRGLAKWIYKFAELFCDHIITISKQTARSLVKDGGIEPDKISLVYPGVKLPTSKQWVIKKKRGQQWLKQHGLFRKKVIITLARLAREKQIDLVIKALMGKQLQQTHLIVIGAGPEKKYLENLANKLGVGHRVHFTGFIDDRLKTSLLSAASVFIFPSSWKLEGFGMTTIEAMAVKTPVITTGSGPQAEIIKNRITGLYFDPHKSHHLTHQIAKLLKNKQLANKLTRSAFQQLKNKFDHRLMKKDFKTAVYASEKISTPLWTKLLGVGS